MRRSLCWSVCCKLDQNEHDVSDQRPTADLVTQVCWQLVSRSHRTVYRSAAESPSSATTQTLKVVFYWLPFIMSIEWDNPRVTLTSHVSRTATAPSSHILDITDAAWMNLALTGLRLSCLCYITTSLAFSRLSQPARLSVLRRSWSASGHTRLSEPVLVPVSTAARTHYIPDWLATEWELEDNVKRDPAVRATSCQPGS